MRRPSHVLDRRARDVAPQALVPTAGDPDLPTLAAAITFGVNLVVVGVFIAWNQIPPRLNWLLLAPLLLEFYVFILGVSLVLATLFVRFRDIGQIWELATQLLLYATPIIYPIGFLPEWARTLASSTRSPRSSRTSVRSSSTRTSRRT